MKFDTVTNTYSYRIRTGLSLAQPTGKWTNTLGYDAAMRLTNVTSPAGTFTYTLGGAGAASPLPKKLLLSNTSYITNTYDAMARLKGTYLKTSGHLLTNKHEYAYNAANQRINSTNLAGTYYTNTYDLIGQLKVGDSSVASEDRRYVYDAAWNLNFRTNNTTTHTFKVDGKNQLTNGYLAGTRTYDNNGNATFSAGLGNGYSYDDENQLVNWYHYESGSNGNGETTDSKDKRTEFVYDGKGRLRKRVEYGSDGSNWTVTSETRYVYDGMRVIQERSSANTPTVSYTRGTDLSGSLEGAGGIGGLLGRSHGYSSGNWSTHSFYHADGNGNVTYLLNSSQSKVAEYRYDPFGNTIASSGTLAAANVYRFSSKEIHLLSWMYYYGYRFYDPNLQRWLNRDPITENGFIVLNRGNTVTLNPQLGRGALKPDYLFVGNNPNTYVDPFGLDFTPDGRITLEKACTKSVYYINSGDPKNPWKWVPIPGSNGMIIVDGIGWWGPDGKEHGRKIPNGNNCFVKCDSQGYPNSFDCKKLLFCPNDRPWTPGGGKPDNLPHLPVETF